jgi:ABC-type polysaccharide/polyol phosphate transport system ATPase subunit
VSAPDNRVVVLEDVWKRYPLARQPNAISRVLARLGGVELAGGSPTDDLDDEDELDDVDEAEAAHGAALDALRDVSLSIEAGACLGLIGRTGAGKSVLLRLVAGLTPPSEGRVLVRGTVAPALASIARLVPARLGVPKTILALAMMTRLPRSDVKHRLPEIFDLAGLPNAAAPGTTLASPQMFRILLAMMLTVEADIVLVDVPFEPGRSQERFLERIRERNREGATIVIAAEHPDELADVTDRFVYLTEGRIVEHGDDGSRLESPTAAEDGGSATIPAARPPSRVLPLSPDAERYLRYIRILIGDRRADRARELAVAEAPADATRVEWTALAQLAGFGYVDHLGVVERLRRSEGVTGEEPIFAPKSARAELPLSTDARIYLDYLTILLGQDRAEQACRTAAAQAPEYATRVEWSWIAKRAGFEYTKQIAVIERLRALHGVPDDEPIFGAREARRKAAGLGKDV